MDISQFFEANFHQGIKLDIIHFSLTDINIRTVIILFSIHSYHSYSIHTPKSSPDEPFVVFVIFSFNFTT